MSKKFIRQIIDGVEKILLVEVVDVVDISSIEKKIIELSDKVTNIDSRIEPLLKERESIIKKIEELEFVLQGEYNIGEIETEDVLDEDEVVLPNLSKPVDAVDNVAGQPRPIEEEVEEKEEEKEMVARVNRPLFRGRASRP